MYLHTGMRKEFVLLTTSIDEGLVDAILFNSATNMLDEALIGLGMPLAAAGRRQRQQWERFEHGFNCIDRGQKSIGRSE
jgi:hypothetical protein